MARYEAGETLASIARTYDCSPPAISYVVSRSRARQPAPNAAAKPPGGSEPQLIKAAAPEGAAPAIARAPMPTVSAAPVGPNGHDRGEPPIVSSPFQRDNDPAREPNGFAGNGTGEPRANPGFERSRPDIAASAAPSLPSATNAGNGTSHPVVPTNGDQRRTLHLSLGSPPQRNVSAPPAELDHQPERPVPPQSPPAPLGPAAPHNGRDAAAPNGPSASRPAAYPEHMRRNEAETAPRREAGAFIDHELRARVDGDIAAFLAAFDAALGHDTQENRAALREATDRLLRAGARTRIELERLEARLPLPPRDSGRPADAARRP